MEREYHSEDCCTRKSDWLQVDEEIFFKTEKLSYDNFVNQEDASQTGTCADKGPDGSWLINNAQRKKEYPPYQGKFIAQRGNTSSAFLHHENNEVLLCRTTEMTFPNNNSFATTFSNTMNLRHSTPSPVAVASDVEENNFLGSSHCRLITDRVSVNNSNKTQMPSEVFTLSSSYESFEYVSHHENISPEKKILNTHPLLPIPEGCINPQIKSIDGMSKKLIRITDCDCPSNKGVGGTHLVDLSGSTTSQHEDTVDKNVGDVNSADLSSSTTSQHEDTVDKNVGDVNSADLSNSTTSQHEDTVDKNVGDVNSDDLSSSTTSQHEDTVDKNVGDVNSADLSNSITSQHEDTVDKNVGDVDSADLSSSTTSQHEDTVDKNVGDVNSVDLSGSTTSQHEDTVDKNVGDVNSADLSNSITSQHEDTVDKNVGDVNSADLSNSITSQHEDTVDKNVGDVDSADLSGSTTSQHEDNVDKNVGDVNSADLSSSITSQHEDTVDKNVGDVNSADLSSSITSQHEDTVDKNVGDVNSADLSSSITSQHEDTVDKNVGDVNSADLSSSITSQHEDTVDKNVGDVNSADLSSSITSQHEDTVDKNVGDVNSADLSSSITSQHEDNVDKNVGDVNSADLSSSITSQHEDTVDKNVGDVNSADLSSSITSQHEDTVDKNVGDVNSADLSSSITSQHEDTVDKNVGDVNSADLSSSITSQHEDTVDKNVGDVNSADLSSSITSQHEDNVDKNVGDVNSADLSSSITSQHEDTVDKNVGDVNSADLSSSITSQHEDTVDKNVGDVDSADLSGSTTSQHEDTVDKNVGDVNSVDLEYQWLDVDSEVSLKYKNILPGCCKPYLLKQELFDKLRSCGELSELSQRSKQGLTLPSHGCGVKPSKELSNQLSLNSMGVTGSEIFLLNGPGTKKCLSPIQLQTSSTSGAGAGESHPSPLSTEDIYHLSCYNTSIDSIAKAHYQDSDNNSHCDLIDLNSSELNESESRNSSLIKFQHQEEVYLKRVDSADIQIVDCDALPQIKRETDLDEDHSICVSELEKSLTISCESVKREINEHVSFGEFIGVDESSLYGHNLLKTEGELKNGPIIATASSGFTVSQQLSEITSCQQGLVELSEHSKCGGLLTAREAYLDFSDGYDDADVIMRIDLPKEAMSIAINDSFYFPEESNFHFEAETNNANRSDVVADSHLQGGHCGGPDCSTRCLPPGTKNEAQLLSCDNIHHSDLINLACPEPTNFESREVRHLKTESQAGLHLYDVYYSNIQNIDTNSKLSVQIKTELYLDEEEAIRLPSVEEHSAASTSVTLDCVKREVVENNLGSIAVEGIPLCHGRSNYCDLLTAQRDLNSQPDISPACLGTKASPLSDITSFEQGVLQSNGQKRGKDTHMQEILFQYLDDDDDDVIIIDFPQEEAVCITIKDSFSSTEETNSSFQTERDCSRRSDSVKKRHLQDTSYQETEDSIKFSISKESPTEGEFHPIMDKQNSSKRSGKKETPSRLDSASHRDSPGKHHREKAQTQNQQKTQQMVSACSDNFFFKFNQFFIFFLLFFFML